MTPILVCTDGSRYAPSVYQHGRWAAERLGAPVEVLHIIERRTVADARDLSGSIGFDENAELLE